MNVFLPVVRCLPFAVTSYMANPECSHQSILGSNCTFSCKLGTRLIGSNKATCEMDDSDGAAKWRFDGERPVCEGKK